jgi:DNA-binding NarL/FixJ family response regulator
MYRILIADDHAVVRQGLKQMLLEELQTVQVGEASNASEVSRQISNTEWSAVILDISMPGKSGLEVLGDIRRARPETPVLVLSVHPEDEYAVRVLKAGAAGYLSKDSSRDQIVSALKKVLSGRRYVSESLAEKLAFGHSQGTLPHQTLSNRELEVLRGIASGKSMTDMADELCLSIKTVSTYRKRVLEKMNMHSNAELTRYALLNNLLGN